MKVEGGEEKWRHGNSGLINVPYGDYTELSREDSRIPARSWCVKQIERESGAIACARVCENSSSPLGRLPCVR